jgi:hypothetical protein
VLRERRDAVVLTWKVAVIVVKLTTTTLLTVTTLPSTLTAAGDVKLVPRRVMFTIAPRPALLGLSEFNAGGAAAPAVIVTLAIPMAEGDSALAASTATVLPGDTGGAV